MQQMVILNINKDNTVTCLKDGATVNAHLPEDFDTDKIPLNGIAWVDHIGGKPYIIKCRAVKPFQSFLTVHGGESHV